MKNIYSNLNLKSNYLLLLLVVLIGNLFTVNAQVKVPFNQRTSIYSPGKTIYNIKGDFTMLGNTNLTLVSYGDETSNNGNMQYVDVDSDSNTWNSSSANLVLSTENGSNPACSNIVYAGLYWTGRASDGTSSPTTFTVTKQIGGSPVTKTFDKRKVSIKGPSSSSYTVLTAQDSDIYYPANGDGFMYSGYIEVTDYVKNNGIGSYTLADIALVEGNGGGTGYYGGWGLVVVYENAKMKWRDVTVFDGHSYVAGSITADFEIPVSGFNTVQAGPVNMKLGMMAGEGDRNISGDYFQIRNHQNTNWVTLNHGANGTNNFFNSSIFTGGNTRNPNLLNNTGLDISMFNIPNTGNTVIKNNQTSTRFRYGTTQDTYVIYNITMSVDAYIPEIEGLLSVQSINGVPVTPGGPYTAQPGQEVEFGIDIKNLGTEAVNDYKLIVPIPFTATFVPGSLNKSVFFSPNPTPNNLYFDPNLGATGSIVWDFGTLPLPANPQTLLASLRFKLKATDNCAILSNPACANNITLYGNTYGTGAITSIPFRDRPLILGYNNAGACQGEPIYQPITASINAGTYVSQNCQDVPLVQNFYYCNGETSVSAAQLASAFPPGSLFYANYPVPAGATPITSFPIVAGASDTYYAVPFNAEGCYFAFTISSCSIINAVNDNFNAIGCTQNGIIGNALINDTLNSNQVTSSNVTFTVTSSLNPNIIFDAQGNISVIPGIAAGQYTFDYTICEISNPTNCSSAVITITIVDTTAPTIAALPEELTINCPATPDFAQAIATDSCGTATLTFVDVRTEGDCAGSYSITRTWTATDASGNTTTASQTINVIDNSAPVIAALPSEITINCPAVPEFTQATATDACNSTFTLTSEDQRTEGDCAGSYSITRTWTATDACGNISNASQTINVIDNTAPVISDLPAVSTISCISGIINRATINFAQASAIDACGSEFTLTFTDETINGDCAGSYSITRTWTATDECGNTSYASQTINVEDATAPVIATLPAISTVTCPAIPEFTQASASDECGSDFTLTFEDTTTNGDCAGSYSITRTWTATDECGNISTASQTINVIDNSAPVIAALPAISTVTCPAVPEFTQATANDACNSTFTLTSEDQRTDGDCAGSYSITRTWTATDACGNSSTASQTINVEDTTAPSLPTAPVATTVACASEVPANNSLTATDACTGDIMAMGVDSVLPGQCINSFVITRTWTFTDACNNSSSVSQIITVNDTVKPIITTQASNIVVECDGTGNQGAVEEWLASNGGATATDNCADVTWSNDFDALANDCSTAITVIFTATDACGNFATSAATFTVQDNNAPIVPQAPAAVEVACASDVPAAIELTATDNCAGEITATGVDSVVAGDCPNSFVITRTWTFTDACSNSSSVSQTITVNDIIAPAFVEALPTNSTVQCDAVPTAETLTATDNCDEANVTFEESTAQGSCPGAYTITRTWTAIDLCGNETSHIQVITVEDTTVPTFVEALPTDSTVQCDAVPTADILTATDNCGEANVTFEETTAQGNCAGTYTITRTWTATDACNNVITHIQTVTVEDNVAPVIAALPAVSTVTCPAVPEFTQATASDECGSDFTLTFEDATTNGNCAGSYSITRTWTATDACGNSSTASQTINVEDATAPVIGALPAISTVTCPVVPEFTQASASDECGSDFTLTFEDATTNGNCAGSYSITRTWTATDACGNSSTASQTINVEDNTAPIIAALPAVSTVECPTTPEFAQATASDECGSDFTLTFEDVTTNGDCAGSYSITRTWTATDACGNAATASQTINVQDTTAPEITMQASNIVVECDGTGNQGAVEAWLASNGGASATDNCSEVTWSNDFDALSNDCSTAITIIFTATDACGNTATSAATFTVQDNTAPIAPEAPAAIEVACASDVPAAIELTATDNCAGEITATGVDSLVAGDCPNSFVITRTWTFTDACSNSSSVSQTITVNDTIAPTFVEVLPTNSTVQCDAVPTAETLTATDNCGEASVTFEETTAQGNCPGAFTITRTWTATDLCNNVTSHIQVITVEDTTVPTFVEVLPTDSTVQCDAVPTADTLTATDNCGEASVTFEETTAQGSCPGAYTITRTWTATDACNNVTSHVQTITVEDTTAPTFVEALPTDSTVQCDAVPTAETLTATDNCGDANVTFEETTAQGSCPGAYTITRTWTATDACNNVTSHVQTITVEDTTAPTFVEALPTDSTVQCDAVPTADTLTATDNCGEASVTFEETTAQGSCPGAYTITRTWTATDACNNVTSHVQTITVEDTTAPTFVEALPTDSTVQCDAVPTAETLTATDNCGDATVTFEETTAQGECAGAYTITRTWTATDACNNVTSHIQTINVQDTTAPEITMQASNIVVECDGTGNQGAVEAWLASNGGATATDNCSDITWTNDFDALANDCSTAITVIFTATDACGNFATSAATFTVQDNNAPIAPEAPAAIEVACASDVPEAIELTATDNCAGEITAIGVDSVVAGDCPNSFVITRTWTFTDACSNSSSVSQTITVNDTIAPAFVEALPTNSTVQCDAVPTAETLTANDNCGEANVTFEETTAQGSCPGAYTITRTWTATDACNNVTSHVQTITIEDTTAPTFVEALPTDSTVQCDAVPTAETLTAADNCGDANVTFEETTAQGSCPGAYTITRTWTATDACNNVTSHVQTITVEDTTAPTFVEALPTDSTVQCDAVPTAETLTATDNCGDANVTFEETTAQGSCPGAYTITRTWTATDACNNVTSHVQTISVEDTTAPTFVEALPTDSTVQCDAVPTADTLTAIDNCGDATVTFEETTAQGSCPGAYTITRTWTATDACNNVTSHVQTITVEDTTAPTFVEALPTDSTVQCDAVPTAETLTATDNCGDASVTFEETTAQGECAGAYTITRTWTATDACNNVTSHIQTINVQDTTAPIIITEASNIVVECDGTGNQGAVEAWLASNGGATATDNCSEVTWSNDFDALANDCSTAVTVIFTATDACGNSTTSAATFTVQDNNAPEAPEAPAAIEVACASDVPAAIELTATDNCAGDITAIGVDSVVAGECPNSFVVTRTWTFTDACSNSSSVSQTITVNDIIAPAFVEALPTNSTVQCDAVPTAETLTATDNCGEASVTFEETTAQGSCPGAYTITRTWTATDACNNVTSHVQTITVEDTTAPTFVEALPTDSTVQCDAVPTAETLTAADNCGDANVTFEETTAQGSCPGAYTITRTWTATDACNNVTSHVQTITVEDTTAPTFVEALPTDSTVQCDAVPTAETLTATDNCGEASVTFEETTTEGSCTGAYTITRTWTATDACNNVTSHVQTISVEDTTAPVFVEALPEDTTAECNNIPEAAILTAMDSCGEATVAFTETIAQGTCVGDYVITRTWTATDLCENTISHDQVIIVQDTTGPIASPFDENISVSCEAIPAVPELTFTDACSTTGEVTFNEETTTISSSSYVVVRTWEVADSCGNISTFTQTITVNIEDSLTYITSTSCRGDITPIDLDSLLPTGTTGGIWVDVDNTGALNGSIFTPSQVTMLGNYILRYEILDGPCPRVYEITMNVNDDCLVFPCEAINIYNAMSPNGDGLNEFFNIENIENTECYPSNSVEIYNRWGVLVYDVQNYDNSSKAFRGVSEGRATVNKSAELPTGTYFYIIQYTTTDGNAVNKSGYLYLTR